MLAGLDVNTLVCKHEVAKVQCEEKLVGKDAVMFVGCCGSGKSTVSAFVTNRSTFKFLNGNLQAQGSVGDFVIGGGAKDVTDGLAIEQIPGKTSLFLVDSAGTGAAYNRETGIVQEISGSLSRQAVFQSARTVRLVLFLSAARCDISNDRGKHCIMDFNLLAEMLSDSADQLDSVGFIVTSPAATLREHARNGRLTYNVIETIQITLKGLMEEGACPDEVATRKGRMLMESCLRCFDAAIEIIQSDDADFELDDGELLPELVKRKCRIFPVNVLATQQDQLQTWLRGLPPIPASSLKCALPSNCKDRLQNLLQEKVFAITDKVKGELSPSAEDEGTTQLMHELSTIVKLLLVLDDSLLPGARQQYMAKLSDVVHKQNSYYAESALDGVATGCAIKLKTAMQGLQLMEAMFAQCQSLQNSGQHAAGFEEVRSKCVTRAEEKFKELFPEAKGISGVSWNDFFIEEFRKLLEIAPELGQQGVELLKKWSHTFKGEVSSLTADVNSAECATQKSIQSAMKLDELDRNLARHRVTEIFQQHACPLPDFSVLLGDAKKNLNDRMASLSKEVFASGQPDMNGNSGKKLRELCLSPDTARLLGRTDLEEAYIIAPLTTTLSQDQINACANKMSNHDAPFLSWVQDLGDVMHTFQSWGDQCARIQEAAKLNLDEVLQHLQEKVKKLEGPVLEAVDLSGSQIDPSDLPLDDLEQLMPFDWLLNNFGKRSTAATRVLENAGMKLLAALKKLLRDAAKARRQTWNVLDMITDERGFDILKNLQYGYGLASSIDAKLQGWIETSPDKLQKESSLSQQNRKRLKEQSEAAKAFVLEVVNAELQEWTEVKIGTRGWCSVYMNFVQAAERFNAFVPSILEVVQKRQQMQQDIKKWHERCVADAQAAEDKWEDFIESAVRQGLALEWHVLADKMRLKADCWQLVQDKADAWKKEAEECSSGKRGSVRSVLEKVSALMQALTPLAQLKMVQNNHALDELLHDLDKAIQGMQGKVSEAVKRFQRLLETKQYCEAAKLLEKDMSDASSKEEFNYHLRKTLDDLCDSLDANLKETEMGSTMQKVNDVHEEIKHVQATAGDLVSQEVRQRIELFNDKLTRLETEATNTLSDWSAWLSQNFKQHLEACAKVQQVREKDILGKMFDEFLASLDPKAELVEVKKWVLLFEAGWEHLTTDQRAERHAEASDAMDKALTSCKKACDGLFKRFKEASNSKEWPKAQETWQELCDAVEILSRLDLNVLQGREANLMKQLSMMPRHYGCRPHNEGKLQRISEQIKMGDFSEAIYALCQTLPDQDDEQRLLQAMNESVDNALHVLGKSWHPQDPADTSKMLELLKNFIDEVGDNPPDVLLSLCEAAQRQCQAKLPQLRATISAAVEHVKGASSSETRDLGGLANSLQEFARFHDAATDEDRNSIKEAVQGFKDAVCQKCLRAKQDIQEQNGEALRQDLRPIETWKEAFIKLDEPKKSMLLSYLFPDVTDDFLSWMHSIIGSASGAVGRTLEDLTKKNGFREINVVLDMQGQVSQLFQGETVDSAPVTKYLASKAAEACAALNAGQIEAFGAEYKALREAMSELPESLKVREHLLKVEGALDSVLEPRMKEIAGARDVEQAKAACFYMRRIADDVPVIHDRVLKSMATGLTLLQSTVDDSTKFLGMLCLQLQLSDMGKKIVDEHRAVFGAAADRARNALFKRTGEIAPNVIAKKVEGSNKDLEGSSLTDSDRNDLRAALEAHEKKLEELQGEWLLGSQSMEEAESKAKSAISLLHFRGQAPVSNEAARNLLTHLAAAYTVARSGPAFFASARAGIQQLENQDALVSPHNGQMVTLYRLLNIGARPGIFSATLKYLQSVVTGSGSKSLCNHLAEVKTGEGKCLTLGMLAAFFALSGLEVDVVCYQPYLVEQDSKAMAPFYKLLGIDGVTKAGRRQIEYHTFDDICEKRLENIQAASKALLSKGGTQGISAPESSTASRALLVDEADVFFGRRFYGQAFNGAFVLDSPEAKSLVKYIYNEQKHGRAIRRITDTSEFNALQGSCPNEMHGALRQIAVSLARNVETFPQNRPSLQDGRIFYKTKGEESSQKSYANETVFAYLHFADSGMLSQEVAEQHLGIDVICGRFSFADIPNQYCAILGVTGTLGEALAIEGIKNMLQDEYKFHKLTYTPSVFGKPDLDFAEREHVRVFKTEEEWIAGIQRLVSEEAKQHAVLLFFKNKETLEKYPDSHAHYSLTEHTSPESQEGIVKAATVKGKVTLLTRAFGRGIDFLMPDENQVVVIQTFLSSLKSEETQIKGRTARQGKKGKYRLYLCFEHLTQKMHFEDDDWEVFESGSGQDVRELLNKRQISKSNKKVGGMFERRKQAAHLELETAAWEKLLFDPHGSPEKKLAKLAEFSAGAGMDQTHYTLLLDMSYSMTGRPFAELCTAYSRFKADLLNSAAKTSTRVSVVFFNSKYEVRTPTHVPAQEMQEITYQVPSNGTSFDAAFQGWHKILNESEHVYNEVALFLTDGYAKVPTATVQGLLSEHGSRISSLTCVAFCADAGAVDVLNQISGLFESTPIEANVIRADSEESLIKIFADAAASCLVHHGRAHR